MKPSFNVALMNITNRLVIDHNTEQVLQLTCASQQRNTTNSSLQLPALLKSCEIGWKFASKQTYPVFDS